MTIRTAPWPAAFPLAAALLCGPAGWLHPAAAATTTAVAAAATTAAATAGTPSPDPALLAEFRRDPDSFFFDLRHLDVVACGNAILGDPAAGTADRAVALRALGQVYAARGARSQARAAFGELFAIDPEAELEPAAAWPPPVVRLFYSVKDSLAVAGPPVTPSAGEAESTAGEAESTADNAGPTRIHTLAIGPIDNQSPRLPDATFDMDRFAAGLTQMIASDLLPATSLRLVDRQRLAVLRHEIALSGSGFTDPDQAVKAGRLLGAQSYLFGGVTLLPGGTLRLDLRLVATETGEILLAASRTAVIRKGEELLKLEREVVETLAERLDQVIGEAAAEAGGGAGGAAIGPDVARGARTSLERRKKIGGAALELLDRTGAAILAEDQGRFAEAADLWRIVAGLDPGAPLAAERIRALETGLRYAQLPEGE